MLSSSALCLTVPAPGRRAIINGWTGAMSQALTERVMSLPVDSSWLSAPRLRGAEAGALMAVASMSCVELALALSVHLFGQLSPVGVACLGLSGPASSC